MKKVTPQRLLQMINPAALRDAIDDAADMFGDSPFAVVVSDPRSMQGCMLIAAVCEPPPEDDATARERAMRVIRRVEGALGDVESTGTMKIQYSCAPLDIIGPHLDYLGLSEVSAGLRGTDDGSLIVVFSVDEVAVASMRLRPVAAGVA